MISAFVVACVALMPVVSCGVGSGFAFSSTLRSQPGLVGSRSMGVPYFLTNGSWGRAVVGADDRIDGLLKSMILLHATYAGITQVPD